MPSTSPFVADRRSGLEAVRSQQRCTWEDFDDLAWVVFLTMQPTADEVVAGIDLKQLRWSYPKAEQWTETTLLVDEAEWQWRDADSGMWTPNHEDGNTQFTGMVAIEWYQNLPFGLAAGRHRWRWHGRDPAGRPLASGAYLVRVITDHATAQGRLTLVR